MIYTIPGPCIPKGRARITTIDGRPRAFTPAKTEKYESYDRMVVAAEMKQRGIVITDGAVKMSIYISKAIPKSTPKKTAAMMKSGEIRPTKKPDVDNYIKSICDALNGVAYVDDSQIVEIRCRKYYDDGQGERVEIELT